MSRSCNGGGVLRAEPLRIDIIDPPDKITVCVGQAVRFEAVAYTSDGVGFISSPEWVWEFGDGEKSEKNPAEHAYEKEGVYTVTVTAIAKEGTGTAETTVEVVGDGGNLLLGNSLYLREPGTKVPIGADGVCDLVEVVFETTDIVFVSPALFRQPPPLVPPNTWDCLGPGTYENTGIPGLKRWYWGWITWDQKNWPVNFKVVYYRPGTPPPFPPPQQQVTFGPVTWTPNNTAVHSDDVVLPWNGEDALTIPWTITHANRNNPLFMVTVSIYVIDATTPIKTFTLPDRGIGVGEVEWNGEVNQGMPAAQPGIYTYKVDAVHNALPICQDTDKSGLLTPKVTHFWCVYLNEPAGTMEVCAEYTLNRDAGACRIEVWGLDPATGEYPVYLTDLDVSDLTEGTHLSDTATIPVLVDENGDVDDRIHAVIYATETDADGELNRDLLPKFAIQRNQRPPNPEVDLDIDGVTNDRLEEVPGAVVVRRFDGNDAPRRKITLRKPSGLETGILALTRNAAAASKTAVYTWSQGGTQIVFDGTDNRFNVGALPTDLYVEGTDASDTMHDILFMLTAEGAIPFEDKVRFTVLWVEISSDHTGSVEADNSARPNYEAIVVPPSEALGPHLYCTAPVVPQGRAYLGRGSEFVGAVHPSDFEPSEFSPDSDVLRMRRQFLNGATYSGPNGSENPSVDNDAADDTSFPLARDDDPQSGGSAGRVYDWDAPGHLVWSAPTNWVLRIRMNFRAYASYDGIRCSLSVPWYTRQSYRKEGPSDTGTVSGSSANSLDDAAKNWGLNQWVNGVVNVQYVGGGAPVPRAVTANGSSTITVSPPWEGPGVGSTYEVIASGAWTLENAVAGDNQSANGMTPISWDLQ